MIGLLTGNSAAEKAQKLAAEQQRVNDARQLQTLNAENQKTTLVRQNPRGRRLLADATTAALPDKVA